MDADIRELTQIVEREAEFVDRIQAEVGKIIVGQKQMMERLLIGLFSGGHILLEGVPGLAKTLAIKTLAAVIQAKFRRIQFTPDLLPADLIGTLFFNQKDGNFYTKKGPIFANFILADEQVTIGEETFPLDEPYMVLATQNPIEQEGTYPLPEAQVDRFMLKIKIDYPSRKEEVLIMREYSRNSAVTPAPVITPQEILNVRETVEKIYVDPKIEDYVLNIVFSTREPSEYKMPELAPLIQYGASPRASIYLIKAARAHAFLRKRGYVIPEDIRAVGMDVLRHRVTVTYEAEAEEVDSEKIIRDIFNRVEVP